MSRKVILLVEDNPDDEELALLAFQQSNVANEVVVARDGVEALDYLFGTGTHAGRDVAALPQVVLLDLKLPKVDGLEVLAAGPGRPPDPPPAGRRPDLLEGGAGHDRELRPGGQQLRPQAGRVRAVRGGVKQLQLYWLVLNEPRPRG